MDILKIEDLEVYAYHGVTAEEQEKGQKFKISAELCGSLWEAGISDNIENTINYATLWDEIMRAFSEEKHNLIEAAAEKLATSILTAYDIEKIIITVKKPGVFGNMTACPSVRIERGWHIVYIALGSNMGDKQKNLKSAIKKITKFAEVEKVSDFYITKPEGFLEQDDFLNAVIKIKTIYEPKELLLMLNNIEKSLKRKRTVPNGPRTIDLDILLFDDLVSSDERLVLPHPRMHQRKFVLEPLNQIAPYALHPLCKKRVFELLEQLNK